MLVTKTDLSKRKDRSSNEEVEEEIDNDPEPKVDVQLGTRLVDFVQPRDERILKKSEISIRLSFLGKTAEGDGYTYLKAACTGMGLTNIAAIKCFKHLQIVDFSNNNLTLADLNPVTKLPFLVFLQAHANKIESGALSPAKYLQVVMLNENQIKSLKDTFQPELSTLEVAYNGIEELTFDNRLDKLRVLDVRNNKIKSLLNLNFPILDSLYLANNKIQSLVGIERLKTLRVLHVRNNPIRFLDGFSKNLGNLQYINLRNTKVTTLRQIRKLQCLPALDVLQLKGTPFFGGVGPTDEQITDEDDDPELRIEAIATLLRLTRLNKTEVSEEERVEAKKLFETWCIEGEKEEDEEMLEEQKEEEEDKGVTE